MEVCVDWNKGVIVAWEVRLEDLGVFHYGSHKWSLLLLG